MKSFVSIRSYLSDLKNSMGAANRQVYAIDPSYVMYAWGSHAFSVMNAIGPFLFAVVGIGYLVETPERNWTVILAGIGGFAIYKVVGEFLKGWEQERRKVFDALLSNHLKSLQVDHTTGLDLGRLVDPAFRKLSRMAKGRGMGSIQSLWRAQKDLVSSTVTIAMSSIALLAIDWVIGVLAVCIAAPSVAKRWMTEQKRRELDEKETMVHLQRSEVHDAIVDPKMATMVRFLGMTKQFVARHLELTDELMENVRLVARYERRWNLCIGLITVFCVMVFSLYFSSELMDGRHGFMEIGLIIGSLRLISVYVGEFGWAVGRLEQERRDHQYFVDFFKTGPVVDESQCKPIVLKETPNLVFGDVAFGYRSKNKLAINGLSATIPPGEMVGLVGPNGCGKTTLLRLIGRVYIPSEGGILLEANGTPLSTVFQESWLRHVVMLTQAAALPGMEIVRAITGGVLKDADMGRLDQALVFSGAKEIISELPRGLATWIGEEWPEGEGFSTGQLQRFALAAAFYRLFDPNVFIALFDEPTANCDAETKSRFYRAIAQAAEFSGKTVIVSLHDPLYLQLFDRVLQFESGRLVNDLRGKEQIKAYQMDIAHALFRDF